jgi:PAS domain S-box-containing protein
MRPRGPVPGGLHTLLFVGFVAVVVLVARTVYEQQRREFDTQLRAELEQIATQEAEQTLSWRQERVGDAEVVMREAALIPSLARLLASGVPGSDRAAIGRLLDALRRSYDYAAVTVCDREGAIRIVSGTSLASDALATALGVRTAVSPSVRFEEIPRGADASRSHFVLGVPLVSDTGPVGAMLLTIDPTRALFTDILRWPGPTTTGDVLLLHRDPDPLVLNDVRGRPTTSMAIRLSALDSRGLISVVRDVDRTPWAVNVRIAEAEAWAPFVAVQRRNVTVSTILIALAAVAIGLLWRHQRRVSHELRVDYDRLARFVNDAILLCDHDGRIIDANDRATDWYGYSRDELLRLAVRDLRAPSSVADFDRAWETGQQLGRLVCEGIGRRKDGSEFPVEISSRTFEVDDQQFTQAVIRDITERKQAETRISRLLRLNSVLSHSGHAIIHAEDERSLYERVCHIAIEYGKFSLAWIALPNSSAQALRPIAAAGPAVAYLETLHVTSGVDPTGLGPTGTAFREDRPVVCADIATDRHMLSRDEAERHGLRSLIALPIRREGRAVGVLTLLSAERQFFDREEAQLATDVAADLSFALDAITHRERIERVLEAIDEGYWDWNLTTGDLHLSARGYLMFGYEPGDPRMTYEQWLDAVHPDERRRVTDALNALTNGSARTVAAEFRVRHRSGEYLWAFGRGKVVETTGMPGQFRFVGTVMDITVRKTLEAQFLQAQKLETVGRLAGGVAHDFNNILTVINGYSDLLLGSCAESDPNYASLEAIQQAGERAAALTRQLLTFSRKHASSPVPTSVGAAVRELQRMMRRILPETVELNIALGIAEDYVLIDPTQLSQVLLNVVVNARDAMPRGGTIAISTRETVLETADGASTSCIALTVSDTGQGIDEQARAHIFEPFFTTKEAGHGTGLGLWTVKEIVEQSGGSVGVESEVGHGSSFHITFPRVAAPVDAPSVRRPSVTALRGSETILLAEDEDAVRKFAAEALRSFGYRVLTAVNGLDALETAEHHDGAIDLLLTDLVMPGMNGRDLATELAARWPRLQCIFMSGYPGDILGEDGIVDPSVRYCPKPFTTLGLLTLVRQALGPSSARPTVLVVDDDPQVRRLFATALAEEFGVLLASDGVEGVHALQQAPRVDVMIVDLFMPRQEGLETIRAAHRLFPMLPIVAMSGAFAGQLLRSAERLGVVATLQKPIALETLRTLVRSICALERVDVRAR